MPELAGKRVLVMGLGRFDGGVGVTRFLAGQGAQVTVTDLLPAQSLTASLAKLADLAVTYKLAGHEESDFTGSDLIVVNPAVDPRGNPYLQAAARAGIPTTSEIRLFLQHLPHSRARTIGITGSAGKSTTTAMIGHILARAAGEPGCPWKKVWVGGNLGGSLLEMLSQIADDDPVVLELSSFMLEDMAAAGDQWSPHVAVLTNITDNHLDRHGTLENYAKAKQEILEHQTPQDLAVLGRPVPYAFIKPRTTRVRFLESQDVTACADRAKLLIPGDHNRMNAAMAIEACAAVGVPRPPSLAALADFPGLPHRLQFVAEHAGVRYYNDSKATTPQATLLALRAFEAGKVHVILGGYDKHADLAPLARFAAGHCQAIYTIGVTGATLAKAARDAGGSAVIEETGTLDAAMRSIAGHRRAGDVVLLSTACASWDQFENYQQRGAKFAELVLTLTGEGATVKS